MRHFKSVSRLVFLTSIFLLASRSPAQQNPAPAPTAPTVPVPARITQAVDENNLVTLKGKVHPLARPEFDQGPVSDAQPLRRMLLLLQRSPEQEAALEQLLEDQQNKSSANYHAWLIPGQFGKQFGPADADIQTLTQWLSSQGFRNINVGPGRNVIEFSGNVASVRNAFHTEIHRYLVNGEEHQANTIDPQIPAALTPVVAGIVSLHNFPRKTMYHLAKKLTRSKDGQVTLVKPDNPELTYQCGTDPNTGQPVYCSELGPYDFAAIYNVLPLWNATPAIDGTGQTIAIANESNINVQDVRSFRSTFGLPANDPLVVLNGPDPGIIPGIETEADLDVELSGGVAKGATIKLVVSQSTETSGGVDLSAEYIVDNNLAPILSVSFGDCELNLGSTGNQFYNNLWQQAAAQGISVFVSSGDNGAAGCDFFAGQTPQPAQNGLQVSGFASTPYNIAVGGTDFNDFFNFTNYWSTTNNSTTQQSANGYIPETSWNDSCTNAIFGDPRLGFSTNAEANCNNSQLSGFVFTAGGSGGKSSCTTPSGQGPTACSGGYAKPSWQIGSGVPLDGKRDVPDVSLFASNGFVGNSYAICESDVVGSCSSTNLLPIGGTSASAPAFAGIMAMVNQKMQFPQGNANVVLYKLATAQSPSTCNSSTGPATTCVFNDVTSGTIAMPCAKNSPNCTTSNANDQYGILSGYSAGAGYDLATGLGSVNVQNLVNNWSSVTFLPSATTLTATVNGTSVSSISVPHGAAIGVSSSVVAAGSGATGTPTGQVALIATPNPTPGNLSGSLGIEALTLTSGSASGTGIILPGGSYNLTAHYQGDSRFGSSDSTPGIPVSITAENSKAIISIPTFSPATGQETGNAPTSLVYGSPYIARIDVGNAQAALFFPPKPVCTPPSCPTGAITWTDSLNGAPASALDGGTFALNSEGYAEDQRIQLPGGSHVLTASYGGDNSYNASSGTYTLTVTPAPTSFGIQLFTTNPVVAGAPFQIFASGVAQTQSGAGPTGTITFFDGTTQLGTPVTVNGNAGLNGASPSFSLVTPLTIVNGGAHTLSAQYSGDVNYASSTSAPFAVNVLFPTTASITFTPTTVNYGSPATITAIVDTAVPMSNAALKPTGTMSLNSTADGQLTNGLTTTALADANGNWEIQTTVTITPSSTENFILTYSGDNNFEGAFVVSNSLTVIIPDFSLSVPGTPFNIPVGQSGSLQVSVAPATNNSSPVTLSCAGNIPVGYSCSLQPSTVNLANGVTATATLTLSPAPAAAPAMIQRNALPKRHGVFLLSLGPNPLWPLSLLSGLAALLSLRWACKRGDLRPSLGFGLVIVISLIIGCGGGSSVGPPPPPPGPTATTTTVTTSAGTVAQNAPVTLTAKVTGTGNQTGSVVFFANGGSIGQSTLTAGSATLNTSLPFAGVYSITAQYQGDANNLSSTSPGVPESVTGSTVFQVNGQTSTLFHSVTVTVTLQ